MVLTHVCIALCLYPDGGEGEGDGDHEAAGDCRGEPEKCGDAQGEVRGGVGEWKRIATGRDDDSNETSPRQ